MQKSGYAGRKDKHWAYIPDCVMVSLFFRCFFFFFCCFFLCKYIYRVLFANWEVRIVKNCDQGLENAAQGPVPERRNKLYQV